MPILFQICVEGNTGSTGTIAEAIGNHAIKMGWTSYIANGRFTRPSNSKLIRIGSDWDVLVHGLLTRFFDRHCLGSTRATRKLVKQIKEIKPDIIQLHHLHGYYINIEILFEFLSKETIPVVWTFHDCWSITGHCAYFDFVGCEKWRVECNNCSQIHEYPASIFADRSRDNYRLKKKLFTSVSNMTVVSVSNWLNSVVRNSFMGGISGRVIYNGVNVDLFRPTANSFQIREVLNKKDGFMILGVASPWSKRKGLNDFIKLSKKIGRNDFIVLVGLNKSQIKELPANIIGITRTENQQQLKDIYTAADVFLNLSIEETFGLATAEALSCGTPAIVYNATACPEVIDSKTGIIVNKNDIDSLVEAIETIKNNGKVFYSAACRERVMLNFNMNACLKEYFVLYGQMLKSKP